MTFTKEKIHDRLKSILFTEIPDLFACKLTTDGKNKIIALHDVQRQSSLKMLLINGDLHQ